MSYQPNLSPMDALEKAYNLSCIISKLMRHQRQENL